MGIPCEISLQRRTLQAVYRHMLALPLKIQGVVAVMVADYTVVLVIIMVLVQSNREQSNSAKLVNTLRLSAVLKLVAQTMQVMLLANTMGGKPGVIVTQLLVVTEMHCI